MNAYYSPRRRSMLPVVVLLALIVFAIMAAAGFYLWPRIESEPPRIVINPAADAVGLRPLQIEITDRGTGLRSVVATVSQGGTEHALASEQFPRPLAEKRFEVSLAKVPGIKEGPAVLRVTAADASLWRGNVSVVEHAITIDVTPPTLQLIADDRYINFGGAGAIVYSASPDTVSSGVKIGNYFFPGFRGQVKGQPDHFFALFAHPYDVAPEVRPALVATDKAGNTRELRLAYELKNVRYRKSTIVLTDILVMNRVAPLLTDDANRPTTVREIFLAVNKGLRQSNDEKITQVTSKSTLEMLWSGAFTQLSNSKVEANFADHRTYTHRGEAIDTAYHLGYDLSVTKNYPVEASNRGVVVFAEDLGIYGNTVIVDHGLGLFTLYSHLSSIDVKPGTTVERRQILGKTGETGLAAGDHLHFGIYLAGVPVLPVEWWDQKWIDDNITPKLEGRTGSDAAETSRPVAPKRSTGKRRR